MENDDISNLPVSSSEPEALVLACVLLVSQPQFDDFEWNVDLPLKPQVWTDQHSQTTDLEVEQIHFNDRKATAILSKFKLFDDGMTNYSKIFPLNLVFQTSLLKP
jgi:hypothetical protein